MVEVFKTNVRAETDASKIVALLRERFPTYQANFDLDDCDKILRIAGSDIPMHEVSRLVANQGFECMALID